MKGDILSKKAVYVVVDEKGKLVLAGGLSETKTDANNSMVEDTGEAVKKAIVIEA